jgi:hypothetical protein
MRSPFDIALVYTALGDKDAMFTWLDKAMKDHSTWLVYSKWEPRLDPLRSDPRFQDLLRRIGLPSQESSVLPARAERVRLPAEYRLTPYHSQGIRRSSESGQVGEGGEYRCEKYRTNSDFHDAFLLVPRKILLELDPG